MYEIPPLPNGGKYQHLIDAKCESGAPVRDVSMGMGGRIDCLLVCSDCRGVVTVDLLDMRWVHAPR